MSHLFSVTVARGAESVLVRELRGFGLQRVVPRQGSVQFMGRLKDGLRACLWSRIGSRVLLRLSRFEGHTPEALYEGVSKIPWCDHLSPRGTFWVDFSGTSRHIRNVQFGARKTKDAIVDRIRNETGTRPDVLRGVSTLRVNVHLRDGVFTVSLDLSGQPLHIRTPGRKVIQAPLKETLAATLLHLAEWPERLKSGEPFVDPMCGSGTLLFEAAGMARKVAPGLSRQDWGFTRWLGHSSADWKVLVDEAAQLREEHRTMPLKIWGMDIDRKAVLAANHNAKSLQLAGVHLSCQPLIKLRPPTGEAGLVIINPPYGERLQSEEELVPLYRQIGDVLRRNMLGWQAYVLAPANRLSKSVGLKSTRRFVINNGAIECRFLSFPVSSTPPQGSGEAVK